MKIILILSYDNDILKKDGDVIINLGFHPKAPKSHR